MRLSDEDLEKFHQHMVGLEYICPQCGCKDVRGFSDLYAIPSTASREISHPLIQNHSYGLLMASCSKCGLVAFFDPAVVGLFSDKSKEGSNQ